MRVSLINLGCKVNRVESDTLLAAFLERGYTTSNLNSADLVLINTCSVTSEAEKKTRKMVRRALREAPHARVCVFGCAVALNPSYYASLDERVIIEPDKSRVLDTVLDAILPDERFDLSFNTTAATTSGTEEPNASTSVFVRMGRDFKTRVGVKIQDGCNNACTFCIVHVARGKAWSRPLNQIEQEVSAYARLGVKEIVLTGINIGSYNFEGITLEMLLERLIVLSPEVRFRISSIEPRDVSDGLIELMKAQSRHICAHMHLPLQSGSNTILKAMARPYKREYFLDLCARLYDALPHMALSTDIIVGFPGETQEDFEGTLEVARQARFVKCHIFPYSLREGTPAAARTDQVEPALKAQRAARMRECAQAIREAEFRKRLGTTEYCLVEDGGKLMTESYFELPYSGAMPVGSLLEHYIEDTPENWTYI